MSASSMWQFSANPTWKEAGWSGLVGQLKNGGAAAEMTEEVVVEVAFEDEDVEEKMLEK